MQQTETARVKTSQVATHLHTVLIHQAKTWMGDCVTHISFLLGLTCVTSMTPVNFPPKDSEKPLLFSHWKMPLALRLKGTTGACVREWSGDGVAYGRVFTLVSAEPAQRASGVSILNKPTVTTLKRPLGGSGRRAGVTLCPPGTELDTPLMSLWERAGLVRWWGGQRELGQTDRKEGTETKCGGAELQPETEAAVTSQMIDWLTLAFILLRLTWPALRCRGTWVTLVPGCRPDPWRQTAGLYPPRSPAICLCSGAQNHTRDCTRNLRWTRKREWKLLRSC